MTLQWVTDVAILASFQQRYFAAYTGGVETFSYWLLIFEVKVSRPDLLATFGAKSGEHGARRRAGFGNLHWIVAEPGLVKEDEVLQPWGLLEPAGSGLRERRQPLLHGIGEERKAEVAETVLWKPPPGRSEGDDDE